MWSGLCKSSVHPPPPPPPPQVFGHREISILDGGLPWWRYRGFSLDQTLPSAVTPREFKAILNTELVRNFQQIYDNFSSKEEQVSHPTALIW